jgi:branched-chain amino acid transport system permease protein
VTLQTALFLLQDAALAGAVYALLALALVLVFSVTRVILVPVGELVSYGGLTAAALEAGRAPPTLWLLCAVRGAVALSLAARAMRGRHPPAAALARDVAWQLAYPLALAALLLAAPLAALPAAARIALALAVVAPLGPGVYRLAYEPVAGASVLVLLIVSVAVHVVLEALGLLMFGPEGARTQPLSEARLDLGPVPVSAHALAVVLLSAALVAALFVLAERTLAGKALRASAMSRVGARLVGIPVAVTGRWSFALAALLAALAGVLLAPVTTLHHDTGFLVGLKGFVGAVVGGLASYPLAAAGALLVGGVEAAASFWASAYKDAIVMALVVPVLAWRSLRARRVEGEE